MMQKLFLDTNILLDLLGERIPFYDPAAKLATLADRNKIILMASPLSFATVNYFLSKFETARIAKEKLRKFKVLCQVCLMDESTINKALNSSFSDFEDALQYFCAIAAQCEIIITRNAKDYKNSLIPVMTANEYLISLK